MELCLRNIGVGVCGTLNLFKEIAPGNNFILGLGDNLPPDGQLERLARIADLVDKYGEYPINVR